MADINFEVNVYCSCGEELDVGVNAATVHNRWQTSLEVEPCQKCGEKQYDAGFSEGERSVT